MELPSILLQKRFMAAERGSIGIPSISDIPQPIDIDAIKRRAKAQLDAKLESQAEPDFANLVGRYKEFIDMTEKQYTSSNTISKDVFDLPRLFSAMRGMLKTPPASAAELSPMVTNFVSRARKFTKLDAFTDLLRQKSYLGESIAERREEVLAQLSKLEKHIDAKSVREDGVFDTSTPDEHASANKLNDMVRAYKAETSTIADLGTKEFDETLAYVFETYILALFDDYLVIHDDFPITLMFATQFLVGSVQRMRDLFAARNARVVRDLLIDRLNEVGDNNDNSDKEILHILLGDDLNGAIDFDDDEQLRARIAEKMLLDVDVASPFGRAIEAGRVQMWTRLRLILDVVYNQIDQERYEQDLVFRKHVDDLQKQYADTVVALQLHVAFAMTHFVYPFCVAFKLLNMDKEQLNGVFQVFLGYMAPVLFTSGVFVADDPFMDVDYMGVWLNDIMNMIDLETISDVALYSDDVVTELQIEVTRLRGEVHIGAGFKVTFRRLGASIGDLMRTTKKGIVNLSGTVVKALWKVWEQPTLFIPSVKKMAVVAGVLAVDRYLSTSNNVIWIPIYGFLLKYIIKDGVARWVVPLNIFFVTEDKPDNVLRVIFAIQLVQLLLHTLEDLLGDTPSPIVIKSRRLVQTRRLTALWRFYKKHFSWLTTIAAFVGGAAVLSIKELLRAVGNTVSSALSFIIKFKTLASLIGLEINIEKPILGFWDLFKRYLFEIVGIDELTRLEIAWNFAPLGASLIFMAAIWYAIRPTTKLWGANKVKYILRIVRAFVRHYAWSIVLGQTELPPFQTGPMGSINPILRADDTDGTVIFGVSSDGFNANYGFVWLIVLADTLFSVHRIYDVAFSDRIISIEDEGDEEGEMA